MKPFSLLAIGFLFIAGSSLRAGEAALPPILREVGFDQRLNAQVPLDIPFQDESNRTVHLRDYFDRKPVILVLAYYRCPMLCTQVLNGLVRTMMDMPLQLGKDFEVITVSFDARETPPLAAAKKETYLERYGRRGCEQGWHFLTGNPESIKRLTDAVGFRFTYDPRNDQFAHASGIMVLTPQGKISHYFYDVRYSPVDLRLGLVEASQGRIGSVTDQILLYCFHYDPTEGKYGPVVMNFVRIGGVLTVLALGSFVGVLWFKERRKTRSILAVPR